MAGLGELDARIASAAADLRERGHVIHKAAQLD
jgi:hypothetical protein